MKVRSFRGMTVIALVAILAGMMFNNGQTTSAQGANVDKAWVRLMHAAPLDLTASLIVNGKKVGDPIRFNVITGDGEFEAVPAGDVEINVMDSKDKLVFEKGLQRSLEPNSLTTFILVGTKLATGIRNINLLALNQNDDLNVQKGFVNIRFVNTLIYDISKTDSKERIPIDFWETDLNTGKPAKPIFSQLLYGQTTPPIAFEIPKDKFRGFTVTEPNGKVPMIRLPLNMKLEEGKVYTFFLTGNTNPDSLPKAPNSLVPAVFRISDEGKYPAFTTPVPVRTAATTPIPPTPGPATATP